MSDATYVIAGHVDPFDEKQLYWSNTVGWVSLPGADVFSDDERQRLHLPLGGKWATKPETNASGGADMGTLIRDSLYIGESPWDESCAQLGTDMYPVNARKECDRFIDQIRNHYGMEPEGARLYTKSNPHDFGSYLSVECAFTWDPSDEDAEWTPSQEYAFAIEGDDKGVLQNWDSDE